MDGHLVPAVRQRVAEGVKGDAGARLEAIARTPEHPGCSQRQEARARFDRPRPTAPAALSPAPPAKSGGASKASYRLRSARMRPFDERAHDIRSQAVPAAKGIEAVAPEVIGRDPDVLQVK